MSATKVKTQVYFSETLTLKLKQMLGSITTSNRYFLSVKKYLLDKDELTFDETLTVLITLQYSHHLCGVYHPLSHADTNQLEKAIGLLTYSLEQRYLLEPFNFA